MKKSFLCGVAALMFAGSSLAAQCVFKDGEIIPGVKEYTLSNGVLQLKCVPESSGVFSGFYDIAEGREMIGPMGFELIIDDLLPRRLSFPKTKSGIREVARGVKMEYVTDFRLEKNYSDAERVYIELYSRSFYSRNISIRKKIELKRGESLAKVTLNFTAHSNREKPMVLWINGIAAMGKKRDAVMMPVDCSVKMRASKGLHQLGTKDGVYENYTSDRDVYAAPKAPWIARYSKERPGVMVLVVRSDSGVVEGGTFCSWKHAQSPLHTSEIIFPEKIAKKGESWTVEYDCIYFAGLKSIRNVVGNYGIDRDGNTLIIASAVPVAGGSLTLDCEGGQTMVVAMPELAPGKVFQIGLPEKFSGTGTLPGGEKFVVFDAFEAKDSK